MCSATEQALLSAAAAVSPLHMHLCTKRPQPVPDLAHNLLCSPETIAVGRQGLGTMLLRAAEQVAAGAGYLDAYVQVCIKQQVALSFLCTSLARTSQAASCSSKMSYGNVHAGVHQAAGSPEPPGRLAPAALHCSHRPVPTSRVSGQSLVCSTESIWSPDLRMFTSLATHWSA